MWEGTYSHTRTQDVAPATVLAAATTVIAVLGPVQEGTCWYVERGSIWSNTAAGTPVWELYVLPTNDKPSANDKAGRQDVETAAASVKNSVRDYKSPIFVPPGYYLVGSWSAIVAADLVAMAFQIRVHDLAAARGAHRHGHMGGPHDVQPADIDSLGE